MWTVAASPALVIGRSARGVAADDAACARLGVEVVRRSSGGGPVLWDAGLLGLDVVLPPGHPFAGQGVIEAYERLGRALSGALRELGVDARAVSVDEARTAAHDPAARRAAELACFGALSPHEVVAGGRKVVGLAQVRRRSGTLLQAGFALRLDGGRLAEVLAVPASERDWIARRLAEGAGGLEGLLAGAGATDVVAAVDGALTACLATSEPARETAAERT